MPVRRPPGSFCGSTSRRWSRWRRSGPMVVNVRWAASRDRGDRRSGRRAPVRAVPPTTATDRRGNLRLARRTRRSCHASSTPAPVRWQRPSSRRGSSGCRRHRIRPVRATSDRQANASRRSAATSSLPPTSFTSRTTVGGGSAHRLVASIRTCPGPAGSRSNASRTRLQVPARITKSAPARLRDRTGGGPWAESGAQSSPGTANR